MTCSMLMVFEFCSHVGVNVYSIHFKAIYAYQKQLYYPRCKMFYLSTTKYMCTENIDSLFVRLWQADIRLQPRPSPGTAENSAHVCQFRISAHGKKRKRKTRTFVCRGIHIFYNTV